jgi:hypothetical protein
MLKMSGRNQISTFNEKSLHAALKAWYAQPFDRVEATVDGFVIDLVRGDLLIEIQTRSFASLKRKLSTLTTHHPVRLVYPIAQEKWIVKLDESLTRPLDRRRSPKRGVVEQLFAELVSFPKLIANPNFSLEILLIREEEKRRYVGPRQVWRRRGWATHERSLLEVVEQRRFTAPADLLALLPATLPNPFTTADLATALAQPRRLAQQMTFCLREVDLIKEIGKQGRAVLYQTSECLLKPEGNAA